MSTLGPDEIANLLAEILAGAAGGTHERWLELIGPVEALPIWLNVKCNWRVTPIATGDELRAILAAVEVVRAEHPYAC